MDIFVDVIYLYADTALLVEHIARRAGLLAGSASAIARRFVPDMLVGLLIWKNQMIKSNGNVIGQANLTRSHLSKSSEFRQ